MPVTIELDEKTAAVIQELATKESRTADDIIRDALLAYSSGKGNRPMPKGMGKYHSGHPDTASRTRKVLRDAVEKGEWP